MRKRILVSSLIVAGVLLTSCAQSPVSSSSFNAVPSSTQNSISNSSSEDNSRETNFSEPLVDSTPFFSTGFDIEKFTPYFERLANYFSEPGAPPEIPKAGFVLEELAQHGDYEKGSYTIALGSGFSTFECYYIPRTEVEKKVESVFYDKSTDFLDNCLKNPQISWLQEKDINGTNFILYGIVLESTSNEVELKKYFLVDDELTVEAIVNHQPLIYTFRLTVDGDYLFEAIKLQ